MMTLSANIARFVARLDHSTIPASANERLRACVVNGFGIALAGLDTPYWSVAARAAFDVEGEVEKGATVLGDGRRTALVGALSANGALFHGRAQEDTCGTAHVGAVVIPMLTSLVEIKGYPMDRFLPALLAGYEIAGLLDGAYGSTTAPMGLRASILYGTIGAAVAAGRLMGLDEDRMAAAIANAASFTGGTLQSFNDGTDEWRYQVGIAAATGLRAAMLAAAGSVSAPNAIEGKAGFVHAFARHGCDVEALASSLGRHWAIERVTFKPYPVCAFNQTPVEAALAMRSKLAGQAPQSVTVRMNAYETGYPGMLEYGPFATVSGTLMSVPFCIATTLLYGAPDMRRMTTYDDEAVALLSSKIEVVTDPCVANLSTIIEVKTTSGETLRHDQIMTAADYAYGRDAAAGMVRRLGAEQGLPSSIYDRLEAFADDLPSADIANVIDLFNPRTRHAAS
ncbi:MmgE/PrpD family protein [Mesorhizobium sp. ASY16-5R]|uniref:MmgE/PrpD family protein n=1 Tax=Mesorhizobium sp. ASY16-5R TaxID=3445772 RepID=UPI003FA142D2